MTDSGAWYETYFGPHYLRIYRLADTAAQLALLCQLLGAGRGRLLDLPCGHGRHCVELAGWGWRVTGLDLEPSFLELARRRARETGVNLELVRGDMRWFPFAETTFDAAICMFTSLGYFDTVAENQLVLAEFARCVKPGGRFILDLANIDHVRRQPGEAAWRKDGVDVRTRYEFDETTRRATTIRDVTFAEGDRREYRSSVRLFEAEEIEGLLAATGWGIDDRLGRYEGGPVSPATPRRILVCRRLG